MGGFLFLFCSPFLRFDIRLPGRTCLFSFSALPRTISDLEMKDRGAVYLSNKNILAFDIVQERLQYPSKFLFRAILI